MIFLHETGYKKISVLLAEFNIPILTYIANQKELISVGDLVEVTLKNKNTFGVVFEINPSCDLPLEKIKPITKKIDGINFNKEHIEFIVKSSRYYLGSMSSFFKMSVPVKKILDYDKNITNPINQFNLAELNSVQNIAYEELKKLTLEKSYSTSVLDGITGSGKTEIYFNLIADHIKDQSKQVLILLPEIVLISQLIDKFRSRFNFEPVQWHSSVKNSLKNKYFLEIEHGDARVIIGTRSALFLPFKNLSLIIVEEEHDHSYKQDDGVNYNARDGAILKAYINNFPVILVSATPSLETFYNVKLNKYNIVKVESRYSNVALPQINICDLRTENMNKKEWISSILKKQILKTFSLRKQILLFLNRRGYAPLLLCRVCGHRFECKHCSSWMVAHKKNSRLECHHCGAQKPIPKECPECKREGSLASCGPGVERIEEEIRLMLPEARIVLMTKDTIKSPQDAQDIIEQIISGEVDIIIGTQLIAKGHHFPKLALVGVIDADAGLASVDLRAPEICFQLLEQVRGRAGRENEQGEVVIQTYNPENKTIKALISGNRDLFYENEIKSRKASFMPPFSRLCAITVSGANEEKVKNIAKKLVKFAPTTKEVNILGPSSSQILRVKRKFRYQILLQTEKRFNLQDYIKVWFSLLKIPSTIYVKADIDPYKFG